MHEQINIYCERASFAFWAEPINFVTNLGFIIVAIFLCVQLRRAKISDVTIWALPALIFIIGVGSALFHSFATRWALLADVIPILLFQILFLYIYMNHVLQARWYTTLIFFIIFCFSIYVFGRLPSEWLNGSLSYAPALLFLGGFAVHYFLTAEKSRGTLLYAFMLFSMSLAFRSVDNMFCDVWPIGTHFMWHILNACVLYLSVISVLKIKS